MASARKLQSDDMELVEIKNENLSVYINLAHAYEGEFSNLTKKMPNELGIFEPDTLPNPPYCGFLLYYNRLPIGFCIAEINDQVNDIAEFYIIPAVRKNGFGFKLASRVFDLYPGHWQVRQITGADNAKAFWQKVIKKYTQNQYTESVVDDAHWGTVTRQQFFTNPQQKSDNKVKSYKNELSSLSVFSSAANKKVIETNAEQVTKLHNEYTNTADLMRIK